MNILEIYKENTEVRLKSSAGTLWEIDRIDLNETGYWLECRSEKGIHKHIRMEDIANGKYKFVNPTEEKLEILREQIPKLNTLDWYNMKVENPENGKLIKVCSALGKRRDGKYHPARDNAIELLVINRKQRLGLI